MTDTDIELVRKTARQALAGNWHPNMREVAIDLAEVVLTLANELGRERERANANYSLYRDALTRLDDVLDDCGRDQCCIVAHGDRLRALR